MGYLPGHRPARETVTINYADVLQQAVENERHRVLREVRAKIERISFFESGVYDNRPRRDAQHLRREVLAAIEVP